MLHFAYASNMHAGLMRTRCPDAGLIGDGVLRHHRLLITTDGYASVAPSPGGVVHGLVWRLSPRNLAVLNAYENVDGGLYRAVHLAVQMERCAVRALVYIGRSAVPGRPRAGYMEIVAAAARAANFPADYVARLERLTAAPSRAAIAPNGVKYE